ncbi:zf-RING_2 domain-containing protein [Cephalotus follicularis]|uniref:RING-type E3 ubiquitin transferase n=1 Tax=Cephalotus follicularis TaxID=3775 RepID=A0A1Q3CXN9_CEPFO|nr:zf-RING_2 domain-containing protein [Cephalotus follicularis]
MKPEVSPFRPSIAVIVGVLTTMFSVTFLLLLYAKHCKRGNTTSNTNSYTNPTNSGPSAARKHSGIDRVVIESLPIFRFGSLQGQKEGLECAVCLNKFEATDVLRLLPKCKHAFHVECVDTWLDAHSTCPLCRYRVDPEDILLAPPPPPPPQQPDRREEDEDIMNLDIESGIRRVIGRHSSADQMPRRSGIIPNPATIRRSLDGGGTVAVGCFDRPRRKDGLLLINNNSEGVGVYVAGDNRTSLDRRLEHRIVVSGNGGVDKHIQRWSDVQPSDLLYLRSEMIIGFSPATKQRQNDDNIDSNNEFGCGRSVINARSVSEITGLSRFLTSSNSHNYSSDNNGRFRERQVGVVSRWLAWISSRSQQHPLVRSDTAPPHGSGIV